MFSLIWALHSVPLVRLELCALWDLDPFCRKLYKYTKDSLRFKTLFSFQITPQLSFDSKRNIIGSFSLKLLFFIIFTPVADNGLNPTWPRKPFQFTVCNSAFAFLRFVVYEIDMFSDQNFLAQATFPIHSLKTGTQQQTAQCKGLKSVLQWHICVFVWHQVTAQYLWRTATMKTWSWLLCWST